MIILTRWYDSRHEKDRAWQQTFIWYVCYGIAVIAATRYSRSRRCTWRFACTRRARASRSRDRTTLYLLFCKCNHCWHSVRDRRSLPGKEYLIRLVLFPHIHSTYIQFTLAFICLLLFIYILYSVFFFQNLCLISFVNKVGGMPEFLVFSLISFK